MLRARLSNPGYPRRQSGAALLVFAALLVLISASILLDRLTSRAQVNAAREQRTTDALAEAKAALIGWAVGHPNEPGRLPWPDRNADGNYDGRADCIAQAVPPNPFNGLWLIGRLPWAGELDAPCNIVAFGFSARDGAGERLWYAVSRNLLWNRGQANPDPSINPGLLDAAPPAYPWLTVCDQAGNQISNRVAAVIIAPGAALPGQARGGPPPNINQFLDGVTVGASTYNNFDSDGLPDAAPCGAPGEDFIIYPDSRTTPAANDSFNDRLTYITIDELMPKVERRVLGDAAVGLEGYRGNYGRYPWLSPYRDPTAFTGGDTLAGIFEEINGAGDDRLVDYEANFPPNGPDQLDDEVIVNVNMGTIWDIRDQHAPDDLHTDDDPDFDVGHAYNVFPAFNGIWGQREGHIPFIDAGETYAFATGWTVTWNNGVANAGPPNCAPPDFDPELTLDAAGCVSLQNSYQAGTGVRAQPTLPIPVASDGACVWTDVDTVDCMDNVGNTEIRPNAYTVDLTCLGGGGGGGGTCGPAGPLPNWPVTRTYTYTMNFTGNGQVSPAAIGNLKTRQVTNTAPLTIQMEDEVTTNGNTYTLWNDTVTFPAGSYVFDGIYFDIEDGVEFPGYFFTNLWHHYVYVKISDEHVAINDAGAASSDNCTPGIDCASLQIGVAPVRNEVRAVIVGAGRQLAGQDRSPGLPALADLTDYFENSNAVTANDTAERGATTAVFNDQVRVVAPFLP